ncbi:MAG TPA: response regulator [Opitutaceae bacterium]|nr:response regulator [Opitutaceae bacterium]
MRSEQTRGTVPAPRPGPTAAGSAVLRILHLEDDLRDRQLVQEALEGGGWRCQVRHAATRDEFEAALEREEFDLIISDFTLPSYDGAAALATARARDSNAPFLYVSGTIGEERAVESLKSGATDYVLKQNLNRLVPAVARALREAAESRRRRAAEEALRAAEARLREMADTIRDVFWVASPDGASLQYISHAYEQVWGRPLAEVYARPQSWLEAVHPEDVPRVREALARLGQGVEYRIEYRVIRPDGTERQVEDRGYPVWGAGGRLERAVGVASDITERRQLEAQLLQSQKLEAIGQLAGGIAHDFNNMLMVINARAKLLLDKGGLDAAAIESLREIFVAGGRAAALTRQLLVFSRKHVMQQRVVDLNELIDHMTQMLRRVIGEDVDLEFAPAHPLPCIRADPGMIEQVLMNLAVNARDAMPRGGHLLIATEPCELSEETRRKNPEAAPGPHVCLIVKDTGCGMPPAVLARAFEPFFTTKEPGHGTGIGLSTVFGIVKHHRGWIEVESAVGAGSKFTIYLPATAERPQGSDDLPPPRPGGGRETILLVEDEMPVREVAKLILHEYGYRVLQATSGQEALEVWRWHGDRIALLLTDLVMPDDMSGLELAARLTKEKPALRVLCTSGYTPNPKRPDYEQLRSMHFLQKPYPPEVLAHAVRAALDGHPPPPLPEPHAP